MPNIHYNSVPFESPPVEITRLSDKYAVTINKFDHKEMSTPEEGETAQEMWFYYTAQFCVGLEETDLIADIKTDPESYLYYEPYSPSIDEKIEAIEAAIDDILMGGI